jgi:pSer/pThr/pTyr-binding forkhead associated (FHA) protein
MNRYRRLHKAVSLPDGRVLITGGLGGESNTANGFLNSAEIYDPATGTFTWTAGGATGGLNTARYNHQATLLYTGKVLIFGGVGPGNVVLDSAELYDPETDTFTTTDSMKTARNNALFTMLPNGKILVSNGSSDTTGTPIQAVEIYDPATEKFTAAGNALVARYYNRIVRLDNGKTIFVGGQTTADTSSVTNTAELDNHGTGVTGTFSATGSLITGRRNFAHWSLPNGRILVAGGYNASGTVLSSAELYTPLIGDEVDTTITSGPPTPTSSTSATFTFTSTAPDSTFHCSLDARPFVACTSGQSYSSLADGTHVFQVHATDSFGNTDPTPATYDWTVDTTAPVVTSFKINAGAATTANRSVTLNNTATKLPTHYMASEDPFFAGAIWQKYSTAPSLALSSDSGKKTVYFKVKNAFHESPEPAKWANITALAPTVTSFKINAGAATTAKGKVTLNNTATNSPTHYMASEDSNFTGADWQRYSTAPSFNLSPVSASPETKTVYFKVKNSFAESSPAKSDEISAAGLPPIVTSFKINAGVASTAKGLVKLNNTATNSPTHYMASEKLDFSDADWQPYSTAPSFNLSVNLTGGNETKTVHFKVKNIFGESSPPAKSDDILALVSAVTSFKINAGVATTAKGKVTLNNTATNSPTHYMASEDSNFTGADWQPYSTAPSFNLSPVSASPETKTVYFKVKNSFAESSPAKSDTITVSGGLPPVVTSFKINAGAASTANSMVTLNNTGTNSPMYYAVSESPTFVGATWQTYSMAPKITLSAESGTKTVYFKTMNIFGESYVVSDTIFLY